MCVAGVKDDRLPSRERVVESARQLLVPTLCQLRRDLRRGQEKTQELTKDYTDRLDKVLKAKEDEIMEV